MLVIERHFHLYQDFRDRQSHYWHVHELDEDVNHFHPMFEALEKSIGELHIKSSWRLVKSN